MDECTSLIVEDVSFRNKRFARKIYCDAFPKEDRIPFWMMQTMAKGKATKMCLYRDGDTYCGMSYVASIDCTTFIMFLAVDGDMRSRGYGSRILDCIKADHMDDIVIVSFEPLVGGAENYETRLKRREFYLHNGFQETGYVGILNGKPQEIMTYNGEFDPEAFRDFFRKYSNGTMRPEIKRI